MGDQPATSVEADEPLTDEDRAAMAQFLGSMRGPSAWVPACVVCMNSHKLAVIELANRLKNSGAEPGTEQWANAFSVAMQFGDLPPGTPVPDGQFVIPSIRSAMTLVNGSAVCMICFVPQVGQEPQRSGLVAASGPMPPVFTKVR